jgi:xanthine dehydrogenase accessory factor
LNADVLERLVEARRDGRAVVLATRLSDGAHALLFPLEPTPQDPGDWPREAAARAVREDVAFVESHRGHDVFLRSYNPPVRLLIVGAVHVAQPLSKMARTLGIEVTVVDPRGAFASDDRFPGIVLVREWPDTALPDLNPDHRTAVVALTHDPKLDDPALRAALDTDAFYVGALGSRKTQAKRLERLAEAGVDSEAMARIRAPIGLHIGARTPSEIALAILAELLAHLRGVATPR